MSQKQHVGSFKWVKNLSIIGEEFIKNYANGCGFGFIFKVDIQYPNKLHYLQ